MIDVANFPMNLGPDLQFSVCKNQELSFFRGLRQFWTIHCHFVFLSFIFAEFVSNFWGRIDLWICRCGFFFATYPNFFTNFKVDFFQLVYLVRARCVKRVHEQQKWPNFIYVIEYMANRTCIVGILLEKTLATLSFCYCETKFEFFRPRWFWKDFFNVVFLSKIPVYKYYTESTIWRTPYSLNHVYFRRSLLNEGSALSLTVPLKRWAKPLEAILLFLKFNLN